MVEIVKSGGWLMLPIILCAIIATGIMLERFWTLQQNCVKNGIRHHFVKAVGFRLG